MRLQDFYHTGGTEQVQDTCGQLFCESTRDCVQKAGAWRGGYHRAWWYWACVWSVFCSCECVCGEFFGIGRYAF